MLAEALSLDEGDFPMKRSLAKTSTLTNLRSN
jgi:hypothetical protein